MTKKTKFAKPELSVEELSRALYEVNLKLQDSNQKLEEANKKLKKQEQQRVEFLANISHDLRAPITALSSSIEYMLSNQNKSYSPELQEDMYDIIRLMQKRTNFMKYLINDVFLLASLDSSDEKVHREPVDIGFFLEDYFYMCNVDETYADVDLKLDIQKDLNITLNIDPNLFHRLLDNLFSNAIKYSKGRPSITLQAYEKDSHIYIIVEDKGIGIPQSHIPKIFNRSYRVEKSRTPEASNSSGFGLSIVKSIIDHHNGTITCESKVGVGSKFIIDLPA